jgi:N-acetylglucosamine malate deacetylase 2
MDWGGRVMIVAPHPDDEAIGAGGHLAELADGWLVFVTDGAPRNLIFARRRGFETREEYALARKKELDAALAVAGIRRERVMDWGIVDQEAVLELTGLTGRFAAAFREVRPDVVLAPPYEGGHPDHDAVAFAVRRAWRTMPEKESPQLFEYPLYHAGGAGTFLENAEGPVETVELEPRAVAMKQRMFDCYGTQREILTRFDVRRERFRRAPDYDFGKPPHAGRLYYENYSWCITGEEWRRLAREAEREAG